MTQTATYAEGVATERATIDDTGAAAVRELLVDAASGRKPKTVARLSDWQYLERCLHRMIAGWGRNFSEWDDIVACHRHIWESAECVRRLRERLEQFPGSTNNLEAPASARLERLANTVLLAPSFQDAVDGIYQIFGGALTRSYLLYASSAHPVHDAPTISMLHEIVGIKESQRLWLRDYRRRNSHTIDATYRAAIEAEIKACDDLESALPVESETGKSETGKSEVAAPVGVKTDFRLFLRPARPKDSEQKHDLMPHLKADFARSLETRRLFWAYGYMLEMNLAVDQLRWIYDGHHMPWEWLQDVSRHLWDESRHGDSGHSRLLDFGITLRDVGFASHAVGTAEMIEGRQAQSDKANPLTPQELYQAVYSIGMIAETAHFGVKREAYDDFKAGGDLESAEMMLFDIIDETAHVQYAHKWLPLLAERAGVDNSDYRERAVREREEIQARHDAEVARFMQAPRDSSDPDYVFYQKLLGIMRLKQPLSNAETCPPRSPCPM